MENKFIDFMQPVFYIGDWLAGHIENIFPKVNANYIGFVMMRISLLIFVVLNAYDMTCGYYVSAIFGFMISMIINGQHSNMRLTLGSAAYKTSMRSTMGGCISLFINTLGMIIICLNMMYEKSVWTSSFVIMFIVLDFVGGLLYFANPLPPKKKSFSFSTQNG